MKAGYSSLLGVFLLGCAAATVVPALSLQEMKSESYTLATWYHIEEKGAPMRIYIEGDGRAFTKSRLPSADPTPQNTFWQAVARADPNPNVAYLARPCQYIRTQNCSVLDWTTGRFSEKIIKSMDQAVLELMNRAETDKVILLGYSGGGQIAAMLSVQHPEKTLYLYTVAGILDHRRWTNYHHASPLTGSRSLELKKIYTIPQMHFVGSDDTVVPPALTQYVMPGYMITVVPGANHTQGWDKIKSALYQKLEDEK